VIFRNKKNLSRQDSDEDQLQTATDSVIVLLMKYSNKNDIGSTKPAQVWRSPGSCPTALDRCPRKTRGSAQRI
jgi:hypothetical protein